MSHQLKLWVKNYFGFSSYNEGLWVIVILQIKIVFFYRNTHIYNFSIGSNHSNNLITLGIFPKGNNVRLFYMNLLAGKPNVYFLKFLPSFVIKFQLDTSQSESFKTKYGSFSNNGPAWKTFCIEINNIDAPLLLDLLDFYVINGLFKRVGVINFIVGEVGWLQIVEVHLFVDFWKIL